MLEQTTKQASSSNLYRIKETVIIIVFNDNKRPREREKNKADNYHLREERRERERLVEV